MSTPALEQEFGLTRRPNREEFDPRFQGEGRQEQPFGAGKSLPYPGPLSNEQAFRDQFGDTIVETGKALGRDIEEFVSEAAAAGAQAKSDFDQYALGFRSQLVQQLAGGAFNQPSQARAPLLSEATQGFENPQSAGQPPGFTRQSGTFPPQFQGEEPNQGIFPVPGQLEQGPGGGLEDRRAPFFGGAPGQPQFPATAQATTAATDDREVQVFTSDGRNILVPLSQAPADARAVGPYVGADPNFNPEFDHEAEKARLRQAGREYLADRGAPPLPVPRPGVLGAPAALLAAAGQNGAQPVHNEVGSGTPLFPPPGGGASGGGFSLPDDVISRLADSNIFGSIGVGMRTPGFLNGAAKATQLMAATKQRNRKQDIEASKAANTANRQQFQNQKDLAATAKIVQETGALQRTAAQDDEFNRLISQGTAPVDAYPLAYPEDAGKVGFKELLKDSRTTRMKELDSAFGQGSPQSQAALQQMILGDINGTTLDNNVKQARAQLVQETFAALAPVEGDTPELAKTKTKLRLKLGREIAAGRGPTYVQQFEERILSQAAGNTPVDALGQIAESLGEPAAPTGTEEKPIPYVKGETKLEPDKFYALKSGTTGVVTIYTGEQMIAFEKEQAARK